jgi:N-acetylglucosamine kinase-like BadF-type ATPase
MNYFLGTDLGATKSHALVADEHGRVLGFGHAGPGNHQSVGYEAMYEALSQSVKQAVDQAGLTMADITYSGFGIAGYDWPSEMKNTAPIIDRLGLSSPYKVVNDTLLGLAAGASEGWGVVVVSGTGCNCRGWDKQQKREGRVTGYGFLMGEFAGASELMLRAMQLVGFSWTKRLPETALSQLMVELAGARDVDDLMEGYTEGRYQISSDAAPRVFELATNGDVIARRLLTWAGVELGEMANAVIRQLEFEGLEFEVVMIGGMFKGGPLLIEPMRETILSIAPKAKLVRLEHPPVMGAVLIAMTEAGLHPDETIRQNLIEGLKQTAPRSSAEAVGG